MKHLFSLLYCLALVLGLGGCGGSGPEATTLSTAPSSGPVSTTAPAELPPVTLEETVIYDQDGVQVTATSLEEGFLGPEIRVTIANDTEQNLTVSSRLLSVNSYMMDTAGLYAEVAAGKKSNDAIALYQSDLDRAGIDAIGEVAFYLSFSDTDTYEEAGKSQLLTISTSAAQNIPPEEDLTGQELYRTDGIRVNSLGLKEDLFWDGTLVLLLENQSQEPVTIYAENVSVNGYMADNAMWCDLRPGTRAVDGMTLLDLENTGVTELSQVEELEFTIRIIHNETWEEIGISDKIRLTFQ